MSVHISARLHDLGFAIGAALLLAAMLPAAWRRAVLPPVTCLATTLIVYVYTINYALMGYWYATTIEYAGAVCWGYLSFIALDARTQVARRRRALWIWHLAAGVAGGAVAFALALSGIGSGIDVTVHDLIFAAAASAGFLALLPAVHRRTLVPVSTCISSASVLAVAFVLNYATMAYWYATGLESAHTACWLALLWTARRAAHARGQSTSAAAHA